MKFTDHLWNEALPVYNKIQEHPFNQEMMAGTLPVEKFKFYIYQDSLYLAEFAKALATAGTKAGTSQELLDFLQFAQNAIIVERILHESYFKEYVIDFDGGKAPGCFAYTNYLLSTAAYESYEVSVAALLPCFWIYKKIGDYIYANQASPNPYQNWIDAYAGEEFAASVEKALSICNNLADQASETVRGKMTEAYLNASKLEYVFWDSAYQLENWKV
ncbi:thiaminase II [Dyadobacter frigoris]|uniref:Aminopyrimidine aminohydrolase n=1 Tax=Dyadobacter frigoris TaxID=2576211 RepID=A0A4U6D674_9BACT|nr:thiaminase II [Dyadobacter frigoris]TKT91717.1 thiaminase II [Dyadobacter frigoris]GLU51715.1 aminopyrimidine aminohydrolase [Dyadobacter frigoris]